jgi:hypothetical protein
MNNNEMKKFKKLLKSTFGLHAARSVFLIWIIEALIKARTVNLSKLDLFIPLKVKLNSIYRRLQRFVQQVSLPEEKLALFIQKFVFQDPNHKHTLVLDRTNWKFGKTHLNFLCLSSCYKNHTVFFLSNLCLTKKEDVPPRLIGSR